MKKQLLTLSLLIFAFVSFANQSSLRIISENNTPFYIYLNGVQQNQQPTLDFQMNGLIYQSYSVRIKFTSMFYNTIHKNISLVDHFGRKGSATYKVMEKYNGKMDLSLLHFNVNNTNSHPVATCENQNGANNYYSNTTIIQNGNTVVTSTSVNNSNSPNGMMNGFNTCYGVHPSNFNRIINAIDDETFSDDQLQLAKRITRKNCLTSNQIKEIAEIFSFEDTRLKYLKFAYQYAHDKNNYWVVNEALTFSSSKRELNQFIQ